MKKTKKTLLAGALAIALAAVAGLSTNVAAQPASPAERTFSVAVHFRYADGFEYDYVLATGVPPSDISSWLSACGQSHWVGSVVRYHCFVIPE